MKHENEECIFNLQKILDAYNESIRTLELPRSIIMDGPDELGREEYERRRASLIKESRLYNAKDAKLFGVEDGD